MARTKQPKVQIKREKTSLGWAYVIYINGMYMGAGLTAASARDGAKRMLVIYERMRAASSTRRRPILRLPKLARRYIMR